MAAMQEQQKQVNTLLLDTSPILLNTPSISTLRATAETLITTAAVVAELRGEEARQRFESLYKPFIEIRAPKQESITHVKNFARRTGDLAVLSATDLEVVALAYDLEVERNGGDWRLRNAPGQRRLNGRPPERKQELTASDEVGKDEKENSEIQVTEAAQQLGEVSLHEQAVDEKAGEANELQETLPAASNIETTSSESVLDCHVDTTGQADRAEPVNDIVQEEESEDSDGGWITASNLKKKQAQDESASSTTSKEQQVLQVATMTGDFAMQNVLLQMNLNLLSTATCKRISHIRQTILRCHACFATTREMTKQFCARCGKPTLTRVSCTTNDRGEVKLHLKQNFQWNNRGNVYSIPKPQAGSANGKWKGKESGGGKNGWGNDLVLAEDQKEYVKVRTSQGRKKKGTDLMDEDVLPAILTGDRAKTGGRVKVGAGRNVNSRMR